jgi:hypothetical protein
MKIWPGIDPRCRFIAMWSRSSFTTMMTMHGLLDVVIKNHLLYAEFI